jgi:hypothetical protein
MKTETIKAVSLKRELQRKAEQKLSKLTEKQQIALLKRKFGQKRRAHKRKSRRVLQLA